MLRVTHIKELATCSASGKTEVNKLGIIRDATILIDGKHIVAVGKTRDILARYPKKKNDREIDATEKIVIPGFVDCHTHLVFAGSRAEEYESKLLGVSYSALHKRGGGIHSTVRATRNATEEELFLSAQKTLREMLRRGTTTVEIKSGYGLTLRDELKILRVIKRLQKTEQQDIIPTFLGAHTIPSEYKKKRGEYVSLITNTMLPKVAEERLVEYVDVFCDPLGFTAKETERIFIKATTLGLSVRIHGEQTAHEGGAEIGARFHAASIDHCDHLSTRDIALMKKANTTAVLLPGVLFHTMEWTKSRLPGIAKKLQNAGVPIALATDYNPGSSPLLSMKLTVDLAMRFLKLSGDECLLGATQIPSVALGKDKLVGSIEAGKQADLLIIDAPSAKDYLHQIGDRTILHIIKNGVIVN